MAMVRALQSRRACRGGGMNVFVVIYYGYEEGEFEVEGVFTHRDSADHFVEARSAGYNSPERYASKHYEIVETPLEPQPP